MSLTLLSSSKGTFLPLRLAIKSYSTSTSTTIKDQIQTSDKQNELKSRPLKDFFTQSLKKAIPTYLFNLFTVENINFSSKRGILKIIESGSSDTTSSTSNITYNNTSFKPKPFFFAMPRVIRDEFDRFNEVSPIIESNEAIKEPNLNIDSQHFHQFYPESNFMKKAMEARRSEEVKIKKLIAPEKKSIWSALSKFFILKSKPLEKEDNLSDDSFDFGRKISVIGLHGWFPNKFIQKVIGDPRRTSDRIVDMLELAVREATPFPPFLEGPASIYKFPLQAEGKIEERVQKHFQELDRIPDMYSPEGLSSIEHLKESDTIIIGAHSQGAPVAIILLAKLLDAGLIDLQKQKVTFLSIAGIFHGPLPSLKKNLVVKYVEADAARQLFELNDPSSLVSKLLHDSLDRILKAGINVTCIASWLDQVVPLYSACLLGFEHPNIWRSVHINGDHFKSDFLTHVINVGLKIKNLRAGLGEPETHMILSHVSEYVAGSIYQHSTHSTGYRQLESYRTALDWMKMGPSSKDKPIIPVDHVRQRPLQTSINPYYLPWLFRGWMKNSDLLGDETIGNEFKLLHAKYQDWRPESKVLKDFKFKLEPLSLLSKL